MKIYYSKGKKGKLRSVTGPEDQVRGYLQQLAARCKKIVIHKTEL